jgi:energy-coupling factor transporter ATP-binding protein EcfA2
MSTGTLAHLELLAEIDALARRLEDWSRFAPPWRPAETCRAIIDRLADRLSSLRARLDSPLIVATLGGTGTGKSSLINALAGAEVVRPGRDRPTTTRPALLGRLGLTPDSLGIDVREVDLVQQDLPALANLVFVDCPDPDTTEAPGPRPGVPGAPSDTTLARLRRILPLCDVLIVTTTQQKYRSARVAEELAAAAPGARLVFVQTHADQDADVRDDWRHSLEPRYQTGHVFFVDSVAALADARQGRAPQGEFAALVDLLTRQFAGAAAGRIRRANFLDLAAQALESCRRRLDEAMGGIDNLRSAIDQQRGELSVALAGQVRGELLSARRPWENRLLGQVTSRWGFSPFSLVLRLYQGIGGLASGALLYRARTPAQLALWGVVEGARSWQKHRRNRRVQEQPGRMAAGGFDATQLRRAAVVLEGYAAEAGLPDAAASVATLEAEADAASLNFVARLSQDLDTLIARQAQRHTGWLTRWRYEFLLLAMMGFLLFRLGKNFFYDSWLAASPAPLWGLESYLASAFWLVLWCFGLLWLFTWRLRVGLRQAIDRLAENWTGASAAAGVFAQLDDDCRRAVEFRRDLEVICGDVERLRGTV